MKTKKRLSGILLSLVLVIGMMPGMSMTVYADDPLFYVGGVPFTGSGSANIGDGTATYDARTHTLTLENCTYSGTGDGIYVNN